MSKKTTVYLAGKITGDPYYRSKFHDAACALAAAGFIVVNPAKLPSEGFTYEAYMRMSGAMLDECAAACFLPDWKDSKGAMYEFGRATAQGKDIFFFEDWKAKHDILSDVETGKVALQCWDCKKISVYPTLRADGRGCAHCGGRTIPIGHAKKAVKTNGK